MSGTITTDHAAEFCTERHPFGSRLANTPHCVECGDALVRCTCEAWVHNLGEHTHEIKRNPFMPDGTDLR